MPPHTRGQAPLDLLLSWSRGGELSLPPGADWQGLLSAIIEHRLNGLVYSEVTDGRIAVPDEIRARLATLDGITWARHMRLRHALLQVGERLEAAQVDWAVLKGVAAEQRYYGRIGERPSFDLDVLIAPHHRDRMRHVVAALQPDHALGDDIQRLVDRGHLQSVNVLLEGTGIPVDVHTDLFELGVPSISPEGVWESMERVSLDGLGEVRMPEHELAGLHFLVHANRDRFRTLLAFHDIARVLRTAGFRTDELLRLVDDQGLRVPALCSLEAAAATMGLDISGVPSPRGARAALWRLLWRPAIRLGGDRAKQRRSRRTQLVLPLLIPGRSGSLARATVRRLFPPPTMVRHLHGEGPYLRTLLRARLEHMRRRRRPEPPPPVSSPPSG